MDDDDLRMRMLALRLLDSGEARKLRHAARVTLAELAADIGVSETSVSRWESGTRLPRGAVATRYGQVLDRLRRQVGARQRPAS